MKKLMWSIAVVAVFTFAGTAMAADGPSLYIAKCQMCHGVGGAGNAMGPKLSDNDFVKGDAAAIKNVITQGVAKDAKKFTKIPMTMPKIALSDAELEAVVAYLKGL